MSVPKILYQFKDCAGKSFRPSNGTEGMVFEEHFCSNCIHEKFIHTQNHKDKQCPVYSGMILFEVNEEDYPPELVFDSEGWPVCTKWTKWDWGSDGDGDPDDEDNPKAPYKPIINQLDLFPFSPAIETIEHETSTHIRR